MEAQTRNMMSKMSFEYSFRSRYIKVTFPVRIFYALLMSEVKGQCSCRGFFCGRGVGVRWRTEEVAKIYEGVARRRVVAEGHRRSLSVE